MKRLLRWCFNGLCLLSLAACAGVAWLAWHGRGRHDWGHAGAVAAGVGLYSNENFGLVLTFVGGWPGRPRAAAGSYRREEGAGGVWLHVQDEQGPRGWRGLTTATGHARFALDGAGDVTSFPRDPAAPRPALSAPLPFFDLEVGYRQAALVTAPPPLLWLALRSRRLIVLRHRRRLGRCLRCGYDLTGNTSGRCSECGEAVEAGGTVTA